MLLSPCMEEITAPLLYGHYCIGTREGNYSGLLFIVSGVKDMDGASFMSVRVSASEALVTQILEGSNSHCTHSKSVFTSDNFQRDAHEHTHMHTTHTHTNTCVHDAINLCFLYGVVSPSSSTTNTPSTIAQISYRSVHSGEECELFQQKK